MLCKQSKPISEQPHRTQSQQSHFATLLKSPPLTDVPLRIRSMLAEHFSPREHLWGTAALCQKSLYYPYILYNYTYILIQVSLVLYFSKYIHLRPYYEFPFILRDLRHIYQCVLRQLRPKSKARAMIGRCKFIKCVVGRKFL